jgi:PAS domain S-box-containing protein
MMTDYLDFKKASCRDCYKCLRECPVKAIEVKDHQAKIIKERCILCGRCTMVCPQNAKRVHSEKEDVQAILSGNTPVFASVAPSFISSFGLQDFNVFRIALGKLGFANAEETAVGANAVTKQYKALLKSGEFNNFITSACPSLCRLIQEYYPKALKYLAPVDSPMIAHAKIIKEQYPDCKIIFVGPCIAKKREAKESGLIDGVLTFEDLAEMFSEKNIVISEIQSLKMSDKKEYANLAKAYPISHGIIKSFDELPQEYEFMAVDGAERCLSVLENIDTLSGVFLEMNMCQDACVNGPCSLVPKGHSIRATMDIHKYVTKEIATHPKEPSNYGTRVNVSGSYPRLRSNSIPATEDQITEILHKTGKFKPEDELNCGACGYSSCREKAWAVINGYADIDMCLPYMRERAESMSYEIIQNSPQGLVVLDAEMKIIEINNKAKELLGVTAANVKGMPAVDYFNPSDFLIAQSENRNTEQKRLYIQETHKYVDLTITLLKANNAVFGILKDVTDEVNYDEKLSSVKMETLATTDNVIQKQMRVAQEIASLLGETTAETKVALLKLKKTLQEGDAQK